MKRGIPRIDPLKDLGKSFYIAPTVVNGFVRGTNLQKRSQKINEKGFYEVKDKKIPATIHGIILGMDVEDRLNYDLIPNGTEAIFLYDLEDGRQVIKYLHCFKKFEDIHDIDSLKIVLKTFCNEFRVKEMRMELKDFFHDQHI